MNIRKLLDSIDEDEAILLSHELGKAIVDKDDKLEIIGGEEHIYISGESMSVPIPCKEFDRASIYRKTELMAKIIMEEL
ncbi:MAG: hypothetical protein IKF82_02350 [Bacilli bacterium]|nr:hypothetical protein [Bacilli bacterium]